MSNTTVRQCKCKNAFQDKKYGEGNRVCNTADKKKIGAAQAQTCTVCGTQHA